MLLDIIIPQYSEDENTIKSLLDSINDQTKVDFSQISVTIVNDYSDVLLSSEFLKSFSNLNISYIRNDKNTGPGLARWKGVLNTNGSFIMFCDSDDKLYDNNVLMVILDFISKYEPDYLVTNIAVEVADNNIVIKKERQTFPWMHGKVYKREFLFNNDIHFHPNIRHLEDSYFTTAVFGSLEPDKVSYLDFTTYLWRNNYLSLTRRKRGSNYMVETFDEFYNTPFLTYEFLLKKKSYLRFSYFASSLLGIYIVLNSNIFDGDELKDKREYYLNKLREDSYKQRNIFVLLGVDKVNYLYNNQINELMERSEVREVYYGLDYFYSEFLKIKK